MKLFTFKSAIICLAFICQSALVSAQEYYAVRPPGSGNTDLLKINISTGKVVSSTPIIKHIHTITGFNGMAVHPTTKALYAIAMEGGIPHLVTINTNTGKLNEIGQIPGTPVSLTFDQNGNLYTREGSYIHQISTVNASSTQITDAAVSTETGIAYNTSDNRVYIAGDNNRLQKVLLTNGTLSVITTGLPDNYFANSLVYRKATNDFIYTTGDEIYEVETDGSSTKLSTEETLDGFIGLVAVEDLSSIDESNSSKALVNIGPLPAEGLLHISLSDGADMHNGIIITSFYNVTGKLVLTSQIIRSSDAVDISALPAGIYTLKLTTAGGETSVHKVLKK